MYNHHHQLFSAGDTISQLNTRTPQLLSIVTALQERFSDMSQLADSVALPDAAEQEWDAVLARAGTGLERVRLMVLADGESMGTLDNDSVAQANPQNQKRKFARPGPRPSRASCTLRPHRRLRRCSLRAARWLILLRESGRVKPHSSIDDHTTP